MKNTKQTNEQILEGNIKTKYLKDIKYIKNELIAKQPNGNYCKFSKMLNAVSVFNLTKDQYINYWKKLYKNTPYLKEILNLCNLKLQEGLVSVPDMIELINKSSDNTSDKEASLKLLGVNE